MHIVLVQSNEIREADFLKDVLAELAAARRKFPATPERHRYKVLAALVEEVGELSEAVLMSDGEGNTKGKTALDVWHEAVQVATMAMRVVLDSGILEGLPEKMADFFDREFGGLTEDDVSDMFDKETGEIVATIAPGMFPSNHVAPPVAQAEIRCQDCDGRGWLTKKRTIICNTCHGTGKVTI